MWILPELESIRTPFLDFLMLNASRLGEEVVFAVVILGSLWCLNKRAGFWMFFSWGGDISLSQLAKAATAVPRPWVRDPSIHPVEKALPAATGYSFPSGHTQSALGLFGSMSVFVKRWWVTIVSVVLVLFTGFSRMYLGVHTFEDVVGAMAIGIILVALMGWLASLEEKHPWITWVAGGLLTAFSAVTLIYGLVRLPEDPAMTETIENGWKMVGASIALLFAWQADRYWLHFRTDAVWYAQLGKFAVGALVALGIMKGLKQPLLTLFGGSLAAHGLRYFLLALFAGVLWPMTFEWWAKLGRKK